MLVVDEAHHLTRDTALYKAVKTAASEIPRLLLPSATPVLRKRTRLSSASALAGSAGFSSRRQRGFQTADR